MANAGSLLSKQAMGGLIGGGGYVFQDAFITSKIPIWLTDDRFHSFTKESFGDVDVHFIDGKHLSHEYFQIKNHQLAPGEFRKTLVDFKALDVKKPELFSKFTVASIGLSQELHPLKAALVRYDGARTSYQGQLTETSEDLVRIMQELNVDGDFEFIRDKVVFEDQLVGLQDPVILKNLFCGSLLSAYEDVAPSLRQAFAPTYSLVSLTSGRPLSRKEITDTIGQAIESHKREIAKAGFEMRFFHWEDEPFIDKESYGAVLDWSTKFNRRQRLVPGPQVWTDELLPELVNLQRTLRKTTEQRVVSIEGSACLSAGFSLGWAFPEVGEWILKLTPRVGSRTEVWSSDAPLTSVVLPTKVQEFTQGEGIAVRYGVVASVVEDFDKFVADTDRSYRAIVDISNPNGTSEMLTNQTALSYSRAAKTIIRDAAKKYSANKVDLFFAGPLGMAIFFGQMLNSMPDIQLHEQKPEGGYQPTALLHSA